MSRKITRLPAPWAEFTTTAQWRDFLQQHPTFNVRNISALLRLSGGSVVYKAIRAFAQRYEKEQRRAIIKEIFPAFRQRSRRSSRGVSHLLRSGATPTAPTTPSFPPAPSASTPVTEPITQQKYTVDSFGTMNEWVAEAARRWPNRSIDAIEQTGDLGRQFMEAYRAFERRELERSEAAECAVVHPVPEGLSVLDLQPPVATVSSGNGIELKNNNPWVDFTTLDEWSNYQENQWPGTILLTLQTGTWRDKGKRPALSALNEGKLFARAYRLWRQKDGHTSQQSLRQLCPELIQPPPSE